MLGACVGNEFPMAVNSSGRVRLFLDASDLALEVERIRMGICDWVGDSFSSGGAAVLVVILLFVGMGLGEERVGFSFRPPLICPGSSSSIDLLGLAVVPMLPVMVVWLFSSRVFSPWSTPSK